MLLAWAGLAGWPPQVLLCHHAGRAAPGESFPQLGSGRLACAQNPRCCPEPLELPQVFLRLWMQGRSTSKESPGPEGSQPLGVPGRGSCCPCGPDPDSELGLQPAGLARAVEMPNCSRHWAGRCCDTVSLFPQATRSTSSPRCGWPPWFEVSEGP